MPIFLVIIARADAAAANVVDSISGFHCSICFEDDKTLGEMVRFAGCCNPLPGDDVVGFVTRGRGVSVHTKDCSHAFALDADRRIEVAWEPKTANPRRIRIRVVSVDQPGLLARVTKSISGAGVNIGAARVSIGDDAKAVHVFDLWVPDLRALTSVMKEVEKVRGVLSVERVRG